MNLSELINVNEMIEWMKHDERNNANKQSITLKISTTTQSKKTLRMILSNS